MFSAEVATNHKSAAKSN